MMIATACLERSIIAAAAENIESTIVFRRPIVSAKCPPSSDAIKFPTP
jgi:hypothetical protein